MFTPGTVVTLSRESAFAAGRTRKFERVGFFDPYISVPLSYLERTMYVVHKRIIREQFASIKYEYFVTLIRVYQRPKSKSYIHSNGQTLR